MDAINPPYPPYQGGGGEVLTTSAPPYKGGQEMEYSATDSHITKGGKGRYSILVLLYRDKQEGQNINFINYILT